MIKDFYSFYPSKSFTQFAFQSEGIQGKIVKIILFTPTGKDREWNIGFGDFKQGKLVDTTLSNNNDALKILRTVAQAILEFYQKHPKSTIQIVPVDEKRKRFYNLIFQKHHAEITFLFDIFGYINKRGEIYSPQIFYDYFKISDKFVK